MVATATGLIRPEAAGVPRSNDEIDRAAAALRADEARAPFGQRQISAMAGCLLAGVDIDPVPAAIAPGAQQQIRLNRAAERAWVIAPHDGDDAPAEGVQQSPQARSAARPTCSCDQRSGPPTATESRRRRLLLVHRSDILIGRLHEHAGF